MTRFAEIRTLIGNAVERQLPDHIVYHYVPRSIIPPCVIVEPAPHSTVNYEHAFSSGFAEWHLTLKIIVGQVDEQWAQDTVSDHISPQSPIITAVEGVKLPTGWVRVTEAGISQMMFGKALYTYAELSVRIKS